MDKKNHLSNFGRDDYKKVTRKLSHGKYLPHEVPEVKAWLMQQEEEASQENWMYHEVLAPKGKKWLRGQVPQLEKEGWVDTPAKFGKSARSKIRRTKNSFVSFWLKNWKWIVATTISPIITIIKRFMY